MSFSKGTREFYEGREGLEEPGTQPSRQQPSRYRDPEAGRH